LYCSMRSVRRPSDVPTGVRPAKSRFSISAATCWARDSGAPPRVDMSPLALVGNLVVTLGPQVTRRPPRRRAGAKIAQGTLRYRALISAGHPTLGGSADNCRKRHVRTPMSAPRPRAAGAPAARALRPPRGPVMNARCTGRGRRRRSRSEQHGSEARNIVNHVFTFSVRRRSHRQDRHRTALVNAPVTMTLTIGMVDRGSSTQWLRTRGRTARPPTGASPGPAGWTRSGPTAPGTTARLRSGERSPRGAARRAGDARHHRASFHTSTCRRTWTSPTAGRWRTRQASARGWPSAAPAGCRAPLSWGRRRRDRSNRSPGDVVRTRRTDDGAEQHWIRPGCPKSRRTPCSTWTPELGRASVQPFDAEARSRATSTIMSSCPPTRPRRPTSTRMSRVSRPWSRAAFSACRRKLE
jgi:hypothetical protein